MTDLKHLLDEAAGEEPVITDHDLAADLSRGKRSARRRGAIAITAGVAATALVIGGGWTLLPDTTPSGSSVDPGVAATPTAKPSTPPARTKRPTGIPGEVVNFKTPPRPSQPVALAPDGKVRPGTDLVCDLMPKGWAVKVYRGEGIDQSSLEIYDPKLKSPGQYYEGSTVLTVRHAKFYREGKRMLVEKYSNTWDELQHYKAGEREAVVAGPGGPGWDGKQDDGLVDVHMKMSETKLIQVFNGTPGLGWDRAMVLRFAGSCHYK